MRRPSIRPKRDIADKHLRRAARCLGYLGKGLPLSIADCLIHQNRPCEYTVLQLNGERRDAAANRLRQWAWGTD